MPIPPGAPGGSGAATAGDNIIPYQVGRPIELTCASIRNATTAVRCEIRVRVPGQGTVVLVSKEQAAISEHVCWTGPIIISDLAVIDFVFLGCVADDLLEWSLLYNPLEVVVR